MAVFVFLLIYYDSISQPRSSCVYTKKWNKKANNCAVNRPWPLKAHMKQSKKTKEKYHTHTQTHMCAQMFMNFLLSGIQGWEGLRGHLCLPQQGLFRARRRVTVLTLWRLLGHLFINVPRRHPEPQHGWQRRVVQHDPDLRLGDGGCIKLLLWLCWTFAYT